MIFASKAADIIAQQGLSETSENPRSAAIAGLLELKDKRGMEVLLDIIKGDSEPYKKLGAIDLAAEKNINDPAFINALKATLKDAKTTKWVKEKIIEKYPELKE